MKSESEIIEDYIDHFEHRDFFEKLTLEEQVLFKCQVRDTLSFALFALHKRFSEFINLLFGKGE